MTGHDDREAVLRPFGPAASRTESSNCGTLLPPGGIAHRLERISAVEAADLLLASVVAGNRSLSLEPAGAGLHVLRQGPGASEPAIVSVDSSLGNAVAARLSRIAGLAFGSAEAQLAITRVRIESSRQVRKFPSAVVDVLLACRATPDGLSVELHRIADQQPEGRRGEDERYRLGRELGHGGMGVVYEAEHNALQKTVALKVLRPALSRDARVAAQFLVEARAACRISHPGVVQVTDYGYLNDGRAFFAMELVHWCTLEVALSDRGTFEPRRAVRVAERIARVLEAASAQGVVHRDLKPANIFIGPRDQVKVCDFGVAWILDREHAEFRDSQLGMTWGTPAYMPPEQAHGGATDVRSDIFSLGLVLLRMVLGYLPDRLTPDMASTATESASKHQHVFRMPTGEIPDAVMRVVQRATATRPQDRYQNALEMRADLHAAARALVRNRSRRCVQ